MGYAEQVQLDKTYVMPTFARKPVELVSGSGMKVTDSEGNEYLDFIAGIGCDSLGHCYPPVVEAIEHQAHKLIHVSNYYYVEHRGEVAKMVSDLLNSFVTEANRRPWKSFFANSGAEANECAIKLARLFARRKREAEGADLSDFDPIIITLEGSFHGRTLATIAATAQPVKQDDFRPLLHGFVHTPINDVEALRDLFEVHGSNICAIMMECIQGESGIHPCTEEFVKAARELTEAYGALLICDEVQSGIFRCGVPFGFQLYGITPDIVAIAKGVACGFPTGMCAAREEVADIYKPGDHGSTFGGSNLAVAAAQATLEAVSKPEVAKNVEKVGDYLRKSLSSRAYADAVRGYGLMVAMDLSDPEVSAPDIVTAALGKGLLLNATGPHTLRFLPPLICTEEDVDALMEGLDSLLA